MKQDRTLALANAPVGKLLFQLATPAILAQVVNLLYNMVDRMYIGHIPVTGSLALTGVGVCFPIMMLAVAFASLISMGGAPRAAIFLGKGEPAQAEHIVGNSFTMLLSMGVVLTVLIQIFAEPLLLLFGASENTLPYALSYLRIFSLGTPFMLLVMGMNPYITTQGFAKTSMCTVFIGACLNLFLDPIFIFLLDMGVRGAAVATILSQSVSMVWILCFLTGKKTILRLQKKYLKPKWSTLAPCMALGISPFIMHSTESVIAFVFNTSLLRYGGDIAVGAMTILNSVMQLAIMPILGLTQGSQAIISFNYGAGNAERVKEGFRCLMVSAMVFSVLIWGAVMWKPELFVQIFNNDPLLVDFAAKSLRIFMAVSFIFGAQVACQQTFLALGNAKSSLLLSLLRKVFLLVPLVYILPLFLENKTQAIFLAEPVADIIAVIITVSMFLLQFKTVLAQMRQDKEKEDKTNIQVENKEDKHG